MPGHALENAWLMLEVAGQRHDQRLLEQCVAIMLCSLEQGWDVHSGGLRYALNIDATPTHPLEADMKLWWPHCEALYALLLGWGFTGDERLARWYDRVHTYTFDRFPDKVEGEWFGYLNRDGSVAFTAKANGWKGCFHMPRVLFRCYRFLSRVVDDETQPPSSRTSR